MTTRPVREEQQGISYPPEPWHLHGDLHAAFLLVPAAALPDRLRQAAPAGWSIVTVAGRTIVGVAWVDYRAPGVLSYRELAVTLLIRRRRRLVSTIPLIWVDSAASLAGGRALWAIPKERADFAFADGTFAASTDAGPLATTAVRPRMRLPLRWPVRLTIVQPDGKAAIRSGLRATARIELTRADVRPTGALQFLTAARHLFAYTLKDFDGRFSRVR